MPAQRLQLLLQSWVLWVEEAALLYCLAEVFQNLCHPARVQHHPGFRDRGMGTPSPELWGKEPFRCRGQQSCLKRGTTALACALNPVCQGSEERPSTSRCLQGPPPSFSQHRTPGSPQQNRSRCPLTLRTRWSALKHFGGCQLLPQPQGGSASEEKGRLCAGA